MPPFFDFILMVMLLIFHFLYKASSSIVSIFQPTLPHNDIIITTFMQFITLLVTDPLLQAIDDFDQLQCLIVGDLAVHCYIREEETEANRTLVRAIVTGYMLTKYRRIWKSQFIPQSWPARSKQN